ncbi:23380_t:CDS:2 [Dentiscutata erythropus]|uniref:23380_t:CDS:1 n=1 Tax=Dentiscutata erythropus TaxID=1348616 RepID=A0A9N8WD49_9GLOM|nr:23380_t:CDS:2 [Dentiscutata erythropus]
MVSSNIKLLYHPEYYHGDGIEKNFFEGWYFKTVSNDDNEPFIVIVGIYRAPSSSNNNESHAFVMVLLSGFDCLYYRYDVSEFEASSSSDMDFYVKIGNNKFQKSGITLDLPSSRLIKPSDKEYEEYSDLLVEDWVNIINVKSSNHSSIESQLVASPTLKQDLLKNIIRHKFISYSIHGHIYFDKMVPFLTTYAFPSVMGPFAYIPFLECNHGLLSIDHRSQGNIELINEENKDDFKKIIFKNGHGYIEKDWGIDFPRSYIWAQTNNFKNEKGSSILFSVADVPFMSSDNLLSKIHFLKKSLRYPGRLIIFYHGSTNTTYNFSTYTLSYVREFNIEMDNSAMQHINIYVSNIQGYHLKISIKRRAGRGIPLRAPVKQFEKMFLRVEESLDAEMSVKLWKKQRNHNEAENVIFHDKSIDAGLEVVGNVMWIAKKYQKWLI